jgi:hypothetical protein
MARRLGWLGMGRMLWLGMGFWLGPRLESFLGLAVLLVQPVVELRLSSARLHLPGPVLTLCHPEQAFFAPQRIWASRAVRRAAFIKKSRDAIIARLARFPC